MIFIRPKFEIWEQNDTTLESVYGQAEKVGRYCWYSMDKMTPDSAKPFCERLLNSKHYSPLEAATLYLYFKSDVKDGIDMGDPLDRKLNFTLNKFSTCKHNWDTHETFVTTNLRVIMEMFPDELEDLIRLHGSSWDPRFERRITVHFTTDRGVSAEANRHRAHSPMESSTRYCNFSKGKFGNQITISAPGKITDEQLQSCDSSVDMSGNVILPRDTSNWCDIDWWVWGNSCSELSYMKLIECGWTAQEARRVLPLDLKTELIHTATVSQWKKFFDERVLGTTGAPHPDMYELVKPLYDEFISRGYL
jgi:thymidylate synthase (FAD)